MKYKNTNTNTHTNAPWEGESMTNTFHTLSSRQECSNAPGDIGICTQIKTHKKIQLQIQSQTNKYIYTEKVKTWPTPFIPCHRDTSAATHRPISEYAHKYKYKYKYNYKYKIKTNIHNIEMQSYAQFLWKMCRITKRAWNINISIPQKMNNILHQITILIRYQNIRKCSPFPNLFPKKLQSQAGLLSWL